MHPSPVPFPYRVLAASSIAAVACFTLPSAALAAGFFGTLTRSNPPASPVGPCAPALTVVNRHDPPNWISTGTSNFGAFVHEALHCTTFPNSSGSFMFDFGDGDTLSGTYSSVTASGSVPMVIEFVGTYVVVAGTGSYAGASGSWVELGRLDRRESTVAKAVGVFRGELNLAPVPEPATWALMLGGLAGVGMLRRRAAAAGA